MAQLAIAFGGAALGQAVGIGGNVGWIIGSVIGTLLFPGGEDTVQEGPRLGDLTVTSSAYGASIPITYGTMRLSGNMIWSTGIEEVKNVKKERQGKGGGGPTNTTITYTYFASFALGFSEGPAEDVLRMWADGKLIYDKTGSGDDITKVNLQFRFYPGNETQQPDGLIQADKGANDTPAYRGLCYIVFDRLPLADFGNRLPNITAEITFNASDDRPIEVLDAFLISEGGEAADFASDRMLPDYDRGVFYLFTTSVTATDNFIRRANTRNMVENRQQRMPALDLNGNQPRSLRPLAVMPDGFIAVDYDLGNTRPIGLINPDTLQIVASFGTSGSSTSHTPTGFASASDGVCSWIEVLGAAGPEYYLLHASFRDSIGILEATGGSLEYIWDSDNAPGQPTPAFEDVFNILGTCAGAVGDGFGEGYVVSGNQYNVARTDNVNFHRMTVRSGAFYDAPFQAYIGTSVDLVATLTPGQILPGETELTDVKGLVYDETDDTIIFQVRDSVSNPWTLKLDPSTGTILWRTQTPSVRNEQVGMNHSRIQDGTYGEMVDTRGWALRTSTGEILYDVDAWSVGHTTSGAGWWDSRTNAFLGFTNTDDNFAKWLFFRGQGGGSSLDSIVADLSERAGLAPTEYDVTPLVGQTVPGYTIGRQSTIRGSMQPLASVYFFDGIESDYVLKFVQRNGKAVSATIPERDLAVLDDNTGEFFRETRVQEVELPLRFSLTYMNREKDYQQAVHNAKRILAPDPAMNSRNEATLQIAASLDPTFAKQAAEQALYSSWIERSTYEVQLPWTYLALDPSDVVELQLDDGALFRTRLVQTDVGQGFTMDVNALSEDAAQYTSDVSAFSGDSGLVQEFLSATITKLILLCTPLLRDSDDVGRSFSQLYYVMGGYGQPGWTAASLFKSAEGTEFVEVGSVVEEMAWGSASNALGDVSDPFGTDETNTLTVFMNAGGDQLASVTQLEMVNGANPAALIHQNGVDVEVIQFREVTVNPDGSYTLSGLLRGRRGTDVFTDGHQVGDTFVLLDAATGGVLPLALGERDQSRFYRPVTSGQRFEDAPITVKASPANDLKPYAVHGATATLGGGNDITIDWVRRTRVGGGLQDGTGGVPVSEDAEEYELEIFDGPGGTEVREVVGLSSPTYTYTSADQTSDGFSPPLTQLTVRIYQISAQVGRGFFREVTIDVE